MLLQVLEKGANGAAARCKVAVHLGLMSEQVANVPRAANANKGPRGRTPQVPKRRDGDHLRELRSTIQKDFVQRVRSMSGGEPAHSHMHLLRCSAKSSPTQNGYRFTHGENS
jgi:hypothetical protein